jgi:competence protein ComEC
MKIRRKLQLLFVLFTLVLTGVFLVFNVLNQYIFTIGATEAIDYLYVHFLDVGQGDASLIKTPNGQNILIDGGPGENILEPLSQVLPWHEQTIDLMILTHPHDDHVAGLIPVIKKYRVNKILYTGVVHTSPTYLEFLDIVKNKKIPLAIINHPQLVNLGEDIYLNIVYPLNDLFAKSVSNLNNTSIVARVVYGDISFLFTGDAEIEVEQELLELEVDLKSEVIKVGHHGSKTSSSEEFVNSVKPDFAVFSLGGDNSFGHPSLRTIKRYERIGSEILRTDLDKTISFMSDGKSIILLK